MGKSTYYGTVSGIGFVRVDQFDTGFVATRFHPNNTYTSNPRAFNSKADAALSMGANTEKELPCAPVNTESSRDIPTEEPAVNVRDMVKHLLALEHNNIDYQYRLLHGLWMRCRDTVLETLPPNLARNIELRVDREAIIRALEALPINTETADVKGALFFVLIGGEWYPLHTGQITEKGTHRWLNGSATNRDGSVDTMTMRWPEWAHVTAGGMPNLNG